MRTSTARAAASKPMAPVITISTAPTMATPVRSMRSVGTPPAAIAA
ncbi:MAG: hypothetical protein QM736_21235 [Vicinamibacterales bacterium]